LSSVAKRIEAMSPITMKVASIVAVELAIASVNYFSAKLGNCLGISTLISSLPDRGSLVPLAKKVFFFS